MAPIPLALQCLLLFPFAAMALTGCASALDRAKGRYTVTCVRIEGNHALSDGAIQDQIATHSDNWSFFKPKPLLDGADLPTDALRIQSLYADHGYFDARVVDYGADLHSNGTASVHFRVSEGDGTRVGRITFEGFDVLADPSDAEASRRLGRVREHLRRHVPLKVGRPWSQPACDLGRERLRKELRDRGFVYAEVSSETRIHRVARTAEVVYTADPGPLARVKSVEITGNRSLPTSRIRRRVDLEPGDVADSKALRRVESNILDLGVFYSVTAEVARDDEPAAGGPPVPAPGPPSERPREVPIRITVQDMPFHEARGGIGASLDNARSDVHAMGGYQDRNLLGGLRFLDIEARPAVVFLPSLFRPDIVAFAATGHVQFRQPSFLEEYLTLSSRLDYTLDVEYGYRSHGIRASLGLSRKFRQFLRLDVSFNGDVYSFFDVSPGLRDPNARSPLGLSFRKLSWLTYLEEMLTVDLRDNVFDPRRGFYGLLATDQSTRFLGSQYDYVRLMADARGYVTPARFLTLAFRAVYGQTFPLGGSDTPLPSRFQGGGLSDNRGFAADREGPFLCRNPDGTVTARGTHGRCPGGLSRRTYIGGEFKLLASAEARWYLPAKFGLVAFLDVGEVWGRAGDVDLRDLNVAVGPGLRYFTPFGPIRADLGVLVTGPSPGAVAFHISIGQAF